MSDLSDQPKNWVLIHCSEDDSHVLLESTCVIYDDEINVDDLVNFAYPGRKKLLTGTVKAMSDNYNALVKLQDSLNKITKPKREPSFHEDQPRRAKLRANQRAKSVNTAETKPPSKSKPKQSKSVLGMLLDEPEPKSSPSMKPVEEKGEVEGADESDNFDDLTDGNDSDTSESDSLTEAELLLIEKLKNKKRSKDFKDLLSLGQQSCKKSKLGNTSSLSVSDESLHSEEDKVHAKDCKTDKTDEAKEKTLEDVGPKISIKALKLKQRKKRSEGYIEIKFDKETLKFKEKEAKTGKLVENSSVFVLEEDLKAAKSCKSASALARHLTRAVFTKEAREKCSVSGKPSMVKGTPEIRTALDQKGVSAIIEYITTRSKKKGWKIPDESSIKQYMGNLLCEERATAKLIAEAEKEAKN